MSKLMMIAGVLLVAVAIASGLMIFFSKTAGAMAGYGVTPEVVATALVGGILALGLGGVIAALEAGAPAAAAAVATAATGIPEFSRRPAEAVAVVAAAVAPEVSPEVTETIRALEQAKSNLRQAFGDEPAPVAVAVPEPAPALHDEAEASERAEAEAPAAAPDAPPTEEEAAADGGDEQLYVVEERVIHNRPARILSDGTVEAETDEGWMRFENLEHLDEYLEAMSPS